MARNTVLWDTTTKRMIDSGALPGSDSYFRANVVSIGSGVTSLTVSFSSSVADTNYTVSGGFENTVDTSPQFQPWNITGKTTTGFTIKWNSETDSVNYKFNYRTSGYA